MVEVDAHGIPFGERADIFGERRPRRHLGFADEQGYDGNFAFERGPQFQSQHVFGMKESAFAAIIFDGKPALSDNRDEHRAIVQRFFDLGLEFAAGLNGVAVPEHLVRVLLIQQQAQPKDILLAVIATVVDEDFRLAHA